MRLVEAMRGHSKALPDRLRERIRRSLRPLRDQAVLALTRALGDDDASMRLNASRMLWQLGSPIHLDDLDPIDITAARDALVTALHDDNRDVRAAAATALGAMQRDAVPAVPALVEALQDEWDGRARISQGRRPRTCCRRLLSRGGSRHGDVRVR